MNILVKTITTVAGACLRNSIERNTTCLVKQHAGGLIGGTLFSSLKTCISSTLEGIQQVRQKTSLMYLHKRGKLIFKKRKKNPFGENVPFAKGVVLKTLIKKPKKPNSANRKCVMVRLSNGKEMVAYVPGIGHNLQEHNIVLCKVGRLKDVPGVKIKCVRGKYDLPHVSKTAGK